MMIVRRIAGLLMVAVAGIALLSPLAARSAAPVATALPEPLLAGAARESASVDRGGLAVREATTGDGARAESLHAAALPTPATALMQPTLGSNATAAPPPAPPAPPTTLTGTSVWDALAECESGGNWSINTGNGYYGGLQFSYATWHDYGGGEFADYPHQATREEQIVVAERLRADRGYAPWPACRAELGLP